MDRLIPDYPKQNDPEIQPKIAAKEEFQEYAGKPDERLSPEKPFFNQQILVMYLMRFLNVLLLYHRAGTGKTITFARSTEDYIDRMNNDGTIGRVIYLSPSGSLEQETKSQLVFRYPNSRYWSPEIENAESIKSRKNKITRAVGRYYDFSTYEKFYKAHRDKSRSALINEFSRKYFIFDEFQLVNDKSEQGREIYTWLKDLIRDLIWPVARIKLLICTATPIIDNVRELVKFANILNPEDVKGTLTSDDPDMEEKIRTWFIGKVSYVRELDTGIRIQYRGAKLTEDSYQVTESGEMGIFQSIVYTKALVEHGSANVWQYTREASDFTFPDGSSGREGAEKYFTSLEDDSFESPLLVDFLKPKTKCKCSKKVEDLLKVPNFKEKIDEDVWEDMGEYYQRILCDCKQKTLENIGKLSIKARLFIESLFRIWKNAYPRKGVTYAYFESVEVGVAPLSICLEVMGFERYRYSKGDIKLSGITISKKLRYIPIIGKKHDKKSILSARDIINHEQNVEGEYIEVVLGSQATRVGLNFYNTINIARYSPWWNPGSSYQAISRAIRATSHETMRRKMEEEMGTDERITVNIYQHCAIPLSISKALHYLHLLITDDEELSEDEVDEKKGIEDYFPEKDLRLYLGFLATGRVAPELIPEYVEDIDVNPNLISEDITNQIDPELYEGVFASSVKELKKKVDLRKLKRRVSEEEEPVKRKKKVDEESSREDDDDEGYDEEELNLGDDEHSDEEMEQLKEEEKKVSTAIYPPSIEVRMYQDTERKDRPNAQALRYVKRVAVDCQLQLERNIRKDENDDSPECDYTVCKYTPYKPYIGPPDLSTYNILYSSKEVETIRLYMKDDLTKTITSANRKKYIVNSQLEISTIPERLAFFELSQEYIVKKYGYTGKVINYGGTIYSDVPLENFYSENLVFTYVDMRNIIIKKKPTELMKVRRIENLEKLESEISKMEAYDIIQLLEDIIDDREHDMMAKAKGLKVESRMQFADQILLAVFNRYIFGSLFDNEKDAQGEPYDPDHIRFRNRPTELINETAEALGKTGKKSESVPSSAGSSRRKSSPDRSSKRKVEDVRILEKYPQAKVEPTRLYIHLLDHLYPPPSNAKYTKMNEYIEAKAKIRVYDSGEWKNGIWRKGIWRDATLAEQRVYSLILQELIQNGFPKNDIYGIITISKSGTEFKVRGVGEKDRNTVTLQECQGRVKSMLYAYLAKLNYKVDSDVEVSGKNVNKLLREAQIYTKTLPPFLQGKNEETYRKRMAIIVKDGQEKTGKVRSYEKKELCSMIKEVLEKKKLLVYLVDWKKGEEMWNRL